jgi:ParB family chromosome partitioning protein
MPHGASRRKGKLAALARLRRALAPGLRPRGGRGGAAAIPPQHQQEASMAKTKPTPKSRKANGAHAATPAQTSTRKAPPKPARAALAAAAAPAPRYRLVTADPRAIRANPHNPRRVAPPKAQDDQLDASLRTVGLIQPPIVVETASGALEIRAGDRRRASAVRIGLPAIDVLVAETEADAAAMIAAAENLVRASMAPTDVWRAIERLEADHPRWNEAAIADALALPPRVIRRFKTLARIHPGMLKVMDAGVMPTDEQLRTISAATADEQAEVWKRLKPKGGQFHGWAQVAHALSKRRMPRAAALFDDALAAEYGVRWQEDLFAPADEDGGFTTDTEAFLAAQTEAVRRALPEDVRLLPTTSWGQPELPKGAVRCHETTAGAIEGRAVDERTGEVVSVHFRLPEPPRTAGTPNGAAASNGHDPAEAPATKAKRADVSARGVAMIGELRTAAIAEAARDAPLDDTALIALLVLAIGGRNVVVQGGHGWEMRHLAATLAEGGVLTADAEKIRATARQVLAAAFSLRQDATHSGPLALVAGITLAAERRLPTMATEEFLATLAKAHLERLAAAENVLPRETGKATRAAMIAQLADRVWLHPAVRFRLDDTQKEDLGDDAAEDAEAGALDGLDEAADAIDADPVNPGDTPQADDTPPTPTVTQTEPSHTMPALAAE